MIYNDIRENEFILNDEPEKNEQVSIEEHINMMMEIINIQYHKHIELEERINEQESIINEQNIVISELIDKVDTIFGND